MSYSKGIMWLDDCRIPFVDEEGIDFNRELRQNELGNIYGGGSGFHKKHINKHYKSQGRFTPNLLVCDDMLNDGSVSKSGSNRKVKQYTPLITQAVKMGGGDKNNEPSDKGTNSRYYSLDLWFNKMVDEL